MKLSDELQLIFGDLVLLLQLIILKLESADGDLEQLVLAFAVHSAVLVKLVLALLILVLLLPSLDLLTKLFFGLLKLLSLFAQLGDRRFQLLDLDVLNFGILLTSKLFHGLEKLLFFALDLRVVCSHVFILVLLEHLAQLLVQPVDLLVKLVPGAQNFLPEVLCLGGAVWAASSYLLFHHGHRRDSSARVKHLN